MALITTSNLCIYLSGGAANTDPVASIGGARSSTKLSSVNYDAWYESFPAPELGETYYRCYYVRNESANAAGLLLAKLWRSLDGSGTVSIGLGAAAKNGTETAIADEHTAPAGVSFSTSSSYATGIDLPDLAQNDFQAIWVKVEATPIANGSGEISVQLLFGGYTYDSTATYGDTSASASVSGALLADVQLGQQITIGTGGTIYRLLSAHIYMDGGGSAGSGTQAVRANLYADSAGYPGALEESSAAGSVTKGDAAAWKTFAMSGATYLTGGAAHWVLMHLGATANVARYYRDASGGSRMSYVTDTYSDGAADPCPAGGGTDAVLDSIYVTVAPLSAVQAGQYLIAWLDSDPPTETTLDVIRVFKAGSYDEPTDITTNEAEGVGSIRVTKVLSSPGSLVFSLVGSTVAQLNTWIDENTSIEWWSGGARKGCYVIDDYVPDWAECTARVNCLGALALASRDVVGAGLGTKSPTNLVRDYALASVVNKTVGKYWRYRADHTAELASAAVDTDGGGQTWLEWIKTLLPTWGDHGQQWWIDEDWFLHAANLKEPTVDAVDVTYAMGDNAHQFHTTYSARDIYNYVKILCPNAPSPYYAICEDETSQATYGYRRMPDVSYDEATTIAAATDYGDALLAKAAYPQAEIIVQADHDPATLPGMLAEVTGLEDGRTYEGIIQQISWTVGDLVDEVVITAKPLTLGMALFGGQETLSAAVRRI